MGTFAVDGAQDGVARLLQRHILGHGDGELALVALRESTVQFSLKLRVCVAVCRVGDREVGEGVVVNELCLVGGNRHRVNGYETGK